MTAESGREASARGSGDDLLTRAKALTGLVTASGIGAVVYALGYAAVNQRAETLGIPDATAAPGTYFRAGYFFLIDSLSACLLTIWEHWSVSAALVGTGAAAVWALAKWIPQLRARRAAVVLNSAIAGGYLVSVTLGLSAAGTMRQAFDARQLLVREDTTLEGLSAPAQGVVKALADGKPDILYDLYASMVVLVVAAGLITAITSREAARRVGVLPTIRHLRWVPVGTTAVAVSLLPFFYGTCYLTTSTLCVSLTFTPQHLTELEKLKLPLDDKVVGLLTSDLDSNPDVVQVLVIDTPPRLYNVDRSKIASIRLLGGCGSVLPGFKEEQKADSLSPG